MKFTKFNGIKNVGDALDTGPQHQRIDLNVDINDENTKITRRGGHGAVLLSGDYHSLWANPSGTIMLAVVGSNLCSVVPSGAGLAVDVTIRTDLTSGLAMNYEEVNDQIYYTNNQVYAYIAGKSSMDFPAISKYGGSRMPAGELIAHFNGLMFTVQGGKVQYSAPYDFGRTSSRKDFLWFPGPVTMFKPVSDGIYCAYGNTTVFLSGIKPKEFIVKEVADYGAPKGPVVSFDASLVSGRIPLQGTAIMWYSDNGLCVGYPGGQMINLSLTKHDAPIGVAGSMAIRKNRKGFMQALTILQN